MPHGREQDLREYFEEAASLFFMRLHFLRQEGDPQQRRKQHCHDPRDNQRNRNYHEQCERVLTGLAAVEPDRYEAGNGHKRACEHRESRTGINVGCRLVDRIACLQPRDHHFHRDHRIIDQKAERNDQRTE